MSKDIKYITKNKFEYRIERSTYKYNGEEKSSYCFYIKSKDVEGNYYWQEYTRLTRSDFGTIIDIIDLLWDNVVAIKVI